MEPIFLLGVDAGGTKTRAVAYTPNGEKIAEVPGAAGNLTAQFDTAVTAIIDAVATLISRLEGRQTTASFPLLCVGAAGATAKGTALQQALAQTFGTRIDRICVISDAELALLAAHGTKDGILIISGTGSIGYRRVGKTILRCGGWGHLLGDEGSGYDIAVSAIRAILGAAETGEDRADALRDALLAQQEIHSLPRLIAYVYSHPKGDIAALCSVVRRCADDGDTVSQQILQHAGEQLGAMVSVLLARQPTDAPLPLAVSGGVFKDCPAVRRAFFDTVAALALPIRQVPSPEEPTFGVVPLYHAPNYRCEREEFP